MHALLREVLGTSCKEVSGAIQLEASFGHVMLVFAHLARKSPSLCIFGALRRGLGKF